MTGTNNPSCHQEQPQLNFTHAKTNEEDLALLSGNLSITESSQKRTKWNLRKSAAPQLKAFFESDDCSSSEGEEKKSSKNRLTHHVSDKKRLKLIKLVTEEGKQIKLVSHLEDKLDSNSASNR